MKGSATYGRPSGEFEDMYMTSQTPGASETAKMVVESAPEGGGGGGGGGALTRQHHL